MAIVQPLYLQKLGYTASNDRLLTEAAVIGIGTLGFNDYAVTASGSNLTLTVGSGRANVRGAATGQGVYHIYNDGPVNVTCNAADSTNPRIDQIILRVYDSAAPANNAQDGATLEILAGSPTAGATLDNRLGAQSTTSISCIVLADILVSANATTLTTSNVRHRNQVITSGLTTKVEQADTDLVSLVPKSTAPFTATSFTQENRTFVAMQFNLPCRVTAPKFRWGYVTGSTSLPGGFPNFGMYDSSGRLLATANIALFNGAVNTSVRREASFTLGATTYEAGNYWFVYGTGVSALSSLVGPCYETDWKSSLPGQVLFASVGAGVTALPQTLSSFRDVYGMFGSVAVSKMPAWTITDV